MHVPSVALRCLLLTVLVGAAGACLGDDRIVYRDRTFADPPPAAAGFLGYDETASKLTVCGNCHVGQQAQWKDSPHASAFATLQSSGGMQDFCQSCHTVNDLGNTLTTPNVGWNATKDVRYHDVQCESCHGPGLQHVTNPDATQPLASIKADTLSTTGCGDCHSGAHHPFVAEWQRSAHGRLVTSSTATTSSGCVGCHTAQGALRRWNEQANFVERDSAPLPQTCVVCHDPHGSSNRGQLRFAVDTPSEQQNLCMQCHNRRGSFNASSPTSTPHAPEGPTILGVAGWWPPAMEFTPQDSAFLGAHGSERNPRLCATCHVERFTVRDTLTEAFVLEVVGHQFLATPCVNAAGIPTGERDCGKDQRRYEACAGSGCHVSAANARGLHALAESRIEPLLAQAENLYARIPTTNQSATRHGLNFNIQLAKKNSGQIVHNPFLLEALLRASIEQVRRDFGLVPTQPLPVATPAMQQLLDRARHRTGYVQVQGR
jgi:predicted CXXCH cytochrome family protein